MSARRRRPIGADAPAQLAIFETGRTEPVSLFAGAELDRLDAPAMDRAPKIRACVTCGSETVGADRCPRCVELGATALELTDEG